MVLNYDEYAYTDTVTVQFVYYVVVFVIIYTMSSKQACGVHKMIASPLHNLG